MIQMEVRKMVFICIHHLQFRHSRIFNSKWRIQERLPGVSDAEYQQMLEARENAWRYGWWNWFDLTVLILKEHSGTLKHDRSRSYEWWENDEFQLLASLSAFILHFSEAASMFRCHASGRDCPECGSQATGSVEESHCSSHLTFPNQLQVYPDGCLSNLMTIMWWSCDNCLRHT